MQRHMLLSGAVRRKIAFNTPLEMPVTGLLRVQSPIRMMLSILHWRCAGQLAIITPALDVLTFSILHWRCQALQKKMTISVEAMAFQYSIGDAVSSWRPPSASC